VGQRGVGEGLRLAELLAALSLATDLAHQVPAESALKDAMLSVAFARHLGLAEPDLSDVYYLALLYHLGCTSVAEEQGRVSGGDDISLRRAFSEPDFTDNAQILRLALTDLANSLPAPDRLKALAKFMTAGKDFMLGAHNAICEASGVMADRLGAGRNVRTALLEVFARWDGKMFPLPPAEGVSLIARITHIVHVAQIHSIAGGPAAAAQVVRKRKGGEFDPTLADAFVAICPELFSRVGEGSVWDQALEAEPRPHRLVPQSHLDQVTLTIADFTDIKSPFTLGHSRQVSRLAEAAGTGLGVSEKDLQSLRQASHIHDLGNVSVPQRVWMKYGPLNRPEQDAVRLHAYHTERILSASRSLRSLGSLAGVHHERLDGSGYHRGVGAASLTLPARILAAAEVYQALVEERSWRHAFAPTEAARMLLEQANGGALDRRAVDAVLEVAGQQPPRRRATWPASLTDREVEVLRFMAAGHSNREIARSLHVTEGTVHTHTINIYAKTNVHTRAGIALFAIEHDLIFAASGRLTGSN
jgi:HD-GYP domain-containing protein (c-di-GMP phosphodiesterase class II)